MKKSRILGVLLLSTLTYASSNSIAKRTFKIKDDEGNTHKIKVYAKPLTYSTDYSDDHKPIATRCQYLLEKPVTIKTYKTQITIKNKVTLSFKGENCKSRDYWLSGNNTYEAPALEGNYQDLSTGLRFNFTSVTLSRDFKIKNMKCTTTEAKDCYFHYPQQENLNISLDVKDNPNYFRSRIIATFDEGLKLQELIAYGSKSGVGMNSNNSFVSMQGKKYFLSKIHNRSNSFHLHFHENGTVKKIYDLNKNIFILIQGEKYFLDPSKPSASVTFYPNGKVTRLDTMLSSTLYRNLLADSGEKIQMDVSDIIDFNRKGLVTGGYIKPIRYTLGKDSRITEFNQYYKGYIYSKSIFIQNYQNRTPFHKNKKAPEFLVATNNFSLQISYNLHRNNFLKNTCNDQIQLSESEKNNGFIIDPKFSSSFFSVYPKKSEHYARVLERLGPKTLVLNLGSKTYKQSKLGKLPLKPTDKIALTGLKCGIVKKY